jgi:hypothetical protein
MTMEIAQSGHTCMKRVKHSNDFGVTHTSVCGKPAIWKDGTAYFCQHHSKKGRFVFRDGDIGEVKARFDTIEDLFAHIPNYPGMIMQHLTKSHRRDIVSPNK